jgi:DNA-binding NtrC family response regulator
MKTASITVSKTMPLNPTEAAVPRHLLLAEDSEETRCMLQHLLEQDPGLRIDAVRNGTEALEALLENHYSILLTDLKMPGVDGMALIEEVQRRRLPVTVIVTTGHGSIDEAVRAIRLGAYDFLTKPIDIDHLRLVLRRALRERALQDEVAQLRDQLQSRYAFHNVLSKNRRMHAVFEMVQNVAHTTSTVLLEGETGTGKEMIARAIHDTSHVRTGPLVAVNCAALPETLLESELFGHEKGAFTNAVSQRKGRFELANGGTLFLDEVGDLPLAMQAKLLRVLQDRCFERVGGTESVAVDVRIIAATNRSLRQLVRAGEFREDLYYRLNVIKIDLPPLRQRPEDIALLARHFIEKYTRLGETPKVICPETMEILLAYDWPGNIRELENAIERACVTTLDDTIRPESLPPELTTPAPNRSHFRIDLSRPLPEQLAELTAAYEERYLRKALKKARGNVGRCAKISGLSRRSITGKLAMYKIAKDPYKH